MYKVSYSTPGRVGTFNSVEYRRHCLPPLRGTRLTLQLSFRLLSDKSVGEEYKVVKRGREYHCCWENIAWKKGKRKRYHRLYNNGTVGKGKGTEMSGKNIKFSKNGDGEDY